MSDAFNEQLPELVSAFTDNYNNDDIFFIGKGATFPNRSKIIEVIRGLRQVMFPGYFGKENVTVGKPDYFVGHLLTQIEQELNRQIYSALAYQSSVNTCNSSIQQQTDEICLNLFQRLPYIQQMLVKDAQAAFDGDPAAQSKEEVILSYPGLFAMFVYRIAHELYVAGVPFIPRLMTEYAHSGTGIDINAGATIGEYFFMDHGTGIVIGETTIIGNHVKLYQGVTLGALSTRSGQQLSGVKRHPTIEDDVTIYSNASVLGGETVIGARSIIGGSSFITESVPPDTRVSIKNPELTFKGPKEQENVWIWEI
jgi:serine O-acetyltransferase